MSKYNLKFLKQIQYNPRCKFETTEENDMGNEHSWEEIKQATCHETLKFFRKNLHSKQVVKTDIKDNLYIVKIYSYAPYKTNERTVHVYTEILEA